MGDNMKIGRTVLTLTAILSFAPGLTQPGMGSWELAPGWDINTEAAGIEAIHMVHLHTGQFLVWKANYTLTPL